MNSSLCNQSIKMDKPCSVWWSGSKNNSALLMVVTVWNLKLLTGVFQHKFLFTIWPVEALYINLFSSLKFINPLTPTDDYSGRTAPLISKHYILYIYSTNTGTEYFKHGINSPLFFLQNAVCFIILTYLVPVLFTYYIQDVLKFKKIIPVPKG